MDVCRQHHTALTLAAYVLYIQFLWQIHSQYTTIFYLNMDTSTGWSVYPQSSAVFGDNFIGCDADSSLWATCCRIRADGADAYIYRSLLTSSYGSLQLQFDISAYDLEPGDTCTVYYAYDSPLEKTLLQSYDPPSGDVEFWGNQTFNLPNSDSVNTLWIWFEVTLVDSGYDYCFVNNLYIKATSKPTISPSKDPSKSPSFTVSPTGIPTVLTTEMPRPTSNPSKSPTARPTDPDTAICGDMIT
eukprot:497328_1